MTWPGGDWVLPAIFLGWLGLSRLLVARLKVTAAVAS